jgi:isopenicillin N synthase-like dioxygenase
MFQADCDAGIGAIPVIDFATFTGSDGAPRATTAASIRLAFEEFGFLYLRNHGVPPGVLDALFAASRAFFALPLEMKVQAGGYSAPGYSAVDPTRPADLKEAFRVYPQRELAPDYWPTDPLGFAMQCWPTIRSLPTLVVR